MLQYIRSFGFIGSFCLCKQPITVKPSGWRSLLCRYSGFDCAPPDHVVTLSLAIGHRDNIITLFLVRGGGVF